jgi:hypothetical protein
MHAEDGGAMLLVDGIEGKVDAWLVAGDRWLGGSVLVVGMHVGGKADGWRQRTFPDVGAVMHCYIHEAKALASAAQCVVGG